MPEMIFLKPYKSQPTRWQKSQKNKIKKTKTLEHKKTTKKITIPIKN